MAESYPRCSKKKCVHVLTWTILTSVCLLEGCGDTSRVPTPSPSPSPPSLDDSLKAEVQPLIGGVFDNTLKAEVQSLIDLVLDSIGFGFGIGIGLVDDRGNDFGVGSGPRTPSDLPSKAAPGTLTEDDTYILGSGTKPYVSVCILRLAEQGKLSLNDTAAAHLDKPMIAMWNTTIVALFGRRAGSITVGDLIFMRSGFYDIGTTSHDDDMLNSPTVWNPLFDLKFLATRSWKWACAPGTCTVYSDINFLLAGLVLLAHSGREPSWQSFDMLPFLGPDFQKARLRHTHFPTVGPLPLRGLTTAGRAYTDSGIVEVYTQDASIMGFSYGNVVASPRDTAKFFFDLLQGGAFISEKSRATMQNWYFQDKGWGAGKLQYGGGLQMRSCDRPWKAGKLTDMGTYFGHNGITWGFRSNQGFYPLLNTSITVMTSQDGDVHVNCAITCRIVKLVAKYRNTKELVAKYRNLRCPSLPSLVVFA